MTQMISSLLNESSTHSDQSFLVLSSARCGGDGLFRRTVATGLPRASAARLRRRRLHKPQQDPPLMDLSLGILGDRLFGLT